MKRRSISQKEFDRKLKIWAIVVPLITSFIGSVTAITVAYISSKQDEAFSHHVWDAKSALSRNPESPEDNLSHLSTSIAKSKIQKTGQYADSIADTENESQNLRSKIKWGLSDVDGDPLHYDIYYGNSLPKFDSSLKEIHSKVDSVPNHTYYWKVIAKNGKDGIPSGDWWLFKTNVNKPILPIDYSKLTSLDVFLLNHGFTLVLLSILTVFSLFYVVSNLFVRYVVQKVYIITDRNLTRRSS